MLLVYEYINRIEQFGSIDMDLIITDSEDENFEPVRISKSFNADVTEEELASAAQFEIDRILIEIEQAPYIEANEFLKSEINIPVNNFLSSLSSIQNNLTPADFRAQVLLNYDLLLALMSGILE